jgi:formylmethanofuran dehydrogenase subunit A
MIQWAIGLELALLIKDPYQLCLTTDHPNGGPFIRYPNVIAWLMNKKYRDSFIPDKIRSRIVLQELDREYSLEEITIITRCSTARILGLNNKGHLGIGADADVAIYNLGGMSPKEIINGFKRAEYFIKDGKLVVRRGTVLSKQLGSTLVIEGKLGESDIFSEVKEKVQKFYSINMDNYSVEDVYIQQKQAIPLCKSI